MLVQRSAITGAMGYATSPHGSHHAISHSFQVAACLNGLNHLQDCCFASWKNEREMGEECQPELFISKQTKHHLPLNKVSYERQDISVKTKSQLSFSVTVRAIRTC